MTTEEKKVVDQHGLHIVILDDDDISLILDVCDEVCHGTPAGDHKHRIEELMDRLEFVLNS